MPTTAAVGRSRSRRSGQAPTGGFRASAAGNVHVKFNLEGVGRSGLVGAFSLNWTVASPGCGGHFYLEHVGASTPHKKPRTMPGLSRSRNCQTTKSELPGEHAAQRLAREVHAIDAAVGSNVGFASEIIVDILQSAQKISGECVFHAAANGKADIFSAGRRRNSCDGCGCYALNETEVRNAESAGREKQPMANGVACLSDQVRCPVKFVSVWRGCGGGDDGEFAVTN